MATSTEIWADLKDFQPQITYYSNTGQAATSETQTFQAGYKKNERGIIRMCEQVAASGNTLILYSA